METKITLQAINKPHTQGSSPFWAQVSMLDGETVEQTIDRFKAMFLDVAQVTIDNVPKSFISVSM